ncbi:hypothetical protein [Sorangium sp. So ce128]|uniref:hypothetical protein n=1 Tax=Sorangium sp. So ce128 TaxID=3133281 RepID=UPI003F619672
MNIMEQAWRPGLITFLIAFAPACIATPADDGQRAEDADDAAEIGVELPRPGALGTVTPEGVAAAENVLAVVRTANGAEVRFFESAAGELSIESTPPSGGADPLAQLDLDALDATEVYEALAGQPAPEALRTAELRAALSERAAETPDVEPVAEGGAALSAPPMSGEEFQQKYCAGMDFCWDNEMNDERMEERAKGIKGFIYAVRGTVVLSIRRKKHGWHQVISREVHPGGSEPFPFDEHWGDLIRRRIKLEVKNATGDQYHLAFSWISPRD